MELSAKYRHLQQILYDLGRTLIAYSGRVASSSLAYSAHQVVGSEMLAVIADSPSLSRFQLQDAIAFAQEQQIPLQVVQTLEMDRPEYVRNDASRCFHCKDELFDVMQQFAREHG